MSRGTKTGLFFDMKSTEPSTFESRNAETERLQREAEKAAGIAATDKLKKLEASIRAKMSPPGALNLPPLLEARRLKYLIPDGAFEFRCLYDRIFVMQILEESDTFIEGGVILMTDSTKKLQRQQTPKGVIVSAGLKAMDNMLSNGIDVGHIVMLLRNAPYRVETDCIDGQYFQVLALRDGDLLASKDLEDNIRAGKCRIERKTVAVDGVEISSHVFVDENGKTWDPALPWISDDI